MKRNILIAAVAVAVLAFSGLVMACGDREGCGGRGGGDRSMQGAMGKDCVSEAGTVKMDNLPNGVKMTLASTKPEEVEAIQERAAKRAANHATNTKCPMKDADMSAENTSDGVVITLTSDKPEVVKAIQAHAAQYAARHGKVAAEKK